MIKTKHKIALANLAQKTVMGFRCLLSNGHDTNVTRSGVYWSLDLREAIDFTIWLLGSFELNTVSCYKRIIKSGDIVLDIGANIGAHTMFLAQAVGPKGKVYAFEPTDYAYAKLCKNCSLNPDLAKRIHCLQLMLVDSVVAGKPTPDLYSSWPLEEERCLHEHHKGRLMTTSGAQASTLDSFIHDIGIERLDCVKIDIDGFECGMLRGAEETLSRWQPPIIMELAPYALQEQGESLLSLIEILHGYGYELYDLKKWRPISMDAAVLENRITSGASMNVIAMAKLKRP